MDGLEFFGMNGVVHDVSNICQHEVSENILSMNVETNVLGTLQIFQNDLVYVDTSIEARAESVVMVDIDGGRKLRYLTEDGMLSSTRFYNEYGSCGVRIEPFSNVKVLGVVVDVIHPEVNILNVDVSNLSWIIQSNKVKYSKVGWWRSRYCPFLVCLNDRSYTHELMEVLHSLIDNRGGVELARIITVCVNMNIITQPTFTQLRQEFYVGGSRQAYQKYLGCNFSKAEISHIVKAVQKYCDMES